MLRTDIFKGAIALNVYSRRQQIPDRICMVKVINKYINLKENQNGRSKESRIKNI